MRDVGYVTEENGVMGVRATFKKRYITLAPVAGIVGLAFNLKVWRQTRRVCLWAFCVGVAVGGCSCVFVVFVGVGGCLGCRSVRCIA